MQQFSILAGVVAAAVPKGSVAALSAAALSPVGQFAVAINAAQAQFSGVADGPVAIRSIMPQPAAASAPVPTAAAATTPTVAVGLAVSPATSPPPAAASPVAVASTIPIVAADLPVAAAASVDPQPTGAAVAARPAAVVSATPAVAAGVSAAAAPAGGVAARSIKPQPAAVAVNTRLATVATAVATPTADTATAPAVAAAPAKPPADQPAPDAALPVLPTLSDGMAGPVGVALTVTAAATPPAAVPTTRSGDAKSGKLPARAADPAPPAAIATVADPIPAMVAPQANAAVVPVTPAPVEAHMKTVSAVGSGLTTSVDALGADARGAAAHVQSTEDENPPAAVPLPDPVTAATVATGLTGVSVAPPALGSPTRPDSVGDSRAVIEPTQQIAAGLQALSRTTEGNLQLVVRLDPPDLGRVQIAIAQPKDGPANVVLMVERPETLLLVLRDQAGLHQALDRAGVAAEGRTIDIQLAPAPPQAGQSQSGGATLDLAREQGDRSARHDPRAVDENDAAAPGTLLRLDPRQTWSRVGIDITA